MFFYLRDALAGCAGYVNVVLPGIYHAPISSMTVATSRPAIDLPFGHLKDQQGVLISFSWFLLGPFLVPAFGGLLDGCSFANFNRSTLLFPACGGLFAGMADDDWRRQIKTLPLDRWGNFRPAEDHRL